MAKVIEVPTIKFNNGVIFPVLGLGTWQGPPEKRAEVGQAVKDAIELGYRHLDCAHIYRNEEIIGEAIASKIADGTVTRKELFVTSKLWNTFHRPDLVEPALRTTLENLKLKYLDLYLMHWPFGFKEGFDLFPTDPQTENVQFSDVDYVDTWKALEDCYKKGLVKAIGVSNFNSLQIERLMMHAKVPPVTNQIECHPYLNQKKLRAFCAQRGITITAYSPLGSPERPWQKPGDPDVLNDPQVKKIAERYGKSPAQILLRYQIQLGNATVPKSSNKQRLADNLNIFDFVLSDKDMEYIDSFDCNGRICPNESSKKHPLYPFQPHIEF